MVSSPAMTKHKMRLKVGRQDQLLSSLFAKTRVCSAVSAGEAALLGDTPMRDDPAVDVVIKVGNDRDSGGKSTKIWVCLKIGYIPNYSHFIGIIIINHWV
jgi:hypothetical protein